MERRTKYLVIACMVAVAGVVNFLSWILWGLASVRVIDVTASTAGHKVTMAPRWYVLADSNSLLGSIMGVKDGAVAFGKAKGFSLAQSEVLIVGPVLSGPKDVSSFPSARFEWGQGLQISSEPKVNVFSPVHRVLITADSLASVREVLSISPDTTK